MAPETLPVLAFVPSALMASQVGAWETDVVRDRTVGDSITAALFGVDPEDAACGLPLISYTRNIHSDDQENFRQKLASIRECGGLFVIEYRTCPSPTDVRWVLARGRYERDQIKGNMVGRGIVIDITESKADGHIEDRAFFVTQTIARPSLEHVAGLALEAREEIDELGEHEASPLRRAMDALLFVIGRMLALRHTEAKPPKRRVN